MDNKLAIKKSRSTLTRYIEIQMKDPAICLSISYNPGISFYSVAVGEKLDSMNYYTCFYLSRRLSKHLIKNEGLCHELFGVDASIEEKKIKMTMLGTSKRKVLGLLFRFKHEFWQNPANRSLKAKQTTGIKNIISYLGKICG